MFSASSLNGLNFVEVKVIDHQFSIEDHLLVKKALSLYTPGFWVPIGIKIFSPDIQHQKRKSYQETYQLFENYSPEWAFSSEELDIINQALKHFIQLPYSLHGSLQAIINRKVELKQIKQILSHLS